MSKTWSDSLLRREDIQQIVRSIDASKQAAPLSAASAEAADLCLALLLTRWIRRQHREAERAGKLKVGREHYLRIEKASLKLLELTKDLEASDDPPSTEWDPATLDDLLFWARCGRSLLPLAGRSDYPHWNIVSELIAYYRVVLGLLPSGAEAFSDSPLEPARPLPTMRFLGAAFDTMRSFTPTEQLRAQCHPPSASQLRKRLLARTDRSRRSDGLPDTTRATLPDAEHRVSTIMRQLDPAFRYPADEHAGKPPRVTDDGSTRV